MSFLQFFLGGFAFSLGILVACGVLGSVIVVVKLRIDKAKKQALLREQARAEFEEIARSAARSAVDAPAAMEQTATEPVPDPASHPAAEGIVAPLESRPEQPLAEATPPFTVTPPLGILDDADIQGAPSLPSEQERILRRIIEAIGAPNALLLATERGTATICLLDVQERDERLASLSVARLMTDRTALHVAASSLDTESTAIRTQVVEAMLAGHRLLLWISGVPRVFGEATPTGTITPKAEAFMRLIEQCQTFPAGLCVLHAFDSHHGEFTRLRRTVPAAFQVTWPLPEAPDRKRQIRALCERVPALSAIEAEQPGWVCELARMAEGLSTGDVSEIFASAERASVMAGVATPSFAMLRAALEEVHRQSHSRSRTGSGPQHLRTPARMRLGTGNARGLDSLAGMEDVKKELDRYRSLVIDRGRYITAGCRVPRGLLLKGSPGVGKTAIARAFADSLGRPFFSVAGSEFVELYVGVGAARVRDLFSSARLAQPCVVFIDELDAIGGRRDGTFNAESTSTLNQLLVEMDGFDVSDGVFVMAATNRVDILDPALTRAGRFDAVIEVPIPDDETRAAILRMLLGQRHSLSAEEVAELVVRTDSFVGAELESLVNRARVDAVLNGGDGHVTTAMLEESLAHAMAARASHSNVTRDERDFYLGIH